MELTRVKVYYCSILVNRGGEAIRFMSRSYTPWTDERIETAVKEIWEAKKKWKHLFVELTEGWEYCK